ncbi:hypothetical protein ACWKSP_26465 [Micromonosporaceae bacterium Da 78-11]
MTQRDADLVHDSSKCGGKRRGADSEGKFCTRPAGWGTDHAGTGRCKLHGGSTPSHIQAGQKALAAQAVKTFGLAREVDPRDALLEEVYRTAGAVDWLAKQVQALDTKDVVWGRAEETTDGVKDKAAPSIWVQLYQQERLHLVRVCKETIAAGVEERRVRLAEQQGSMLAGVIKAILGDLDLSPEQAAKVSTVVPRHLRSVA